MHVALTVYWLTSSKTQALCIKLIYIYITHCTVAFDLVKSARVFY